MIAIIDYGMGNVRSVFNACTVLDVTTEVTCDHDKIRQASGIILPGVGAFADGMAALAQRGLVELLNSEVHVGRKPFLGICLGMQMLATCGTEHGRREGLGWLNGTVDLLPVPACKKDIRLPHIGWNTVKFVKSGGLYAGMKQPADFYFVHSYALMPHDDSIVSGVCEHGDPFVASVEADNIWATQFHPEKSHKNGLALLNNWLQRAASC